MWFKSTADLVVDSTTTLGLSGSETTAVALAAALGAEYCEIFTDVDGVFDADPRVVPKALPLRQIHPQEMRALAWSGVRVLKAEAVEFARDRYSRLLAQQRSQSRCR